MMVVPTWVAVLGYCLGILTGWIIWRRADKRETGNERDPSAGAAGKEGAE
jgi:hypothetical protein